MTHNYLYFVAALLMAAPATAQDDPDARDAAAHNAVFDAGATMGLSPQTMSEYMNCSAYWNRWAYVVESAADPAFVKGLRPELSAAHAKKRSIYFQREARRARYEAIDDNEFAQDRADAEEEADETYSAYVKDEPRGFFNFLQSLGICQ